MPKPKQNQPDDRTIPVDWLYGIPPEEKDSFIEAWRNSTFVLDKLKKYIERELKSLDLDKEDDYQNPNWPIARADKNGQVRSFKKIFRLLP